MSSHRRNSVIMVGSEFVNNTLSDRLHGLDFDPSAQYATTPATKSSRAVKRPIWDRDCLTTRSVVAILRARKEAARRRDASGERSASKQRCSSVRATSLNHRESELFETPRAELIWRYEQPSRRMRTAQSLKWSFARGRRVQSGAGIPAIHRSSVRTLRMPNSFKICARDQPALRSSLARMRFAA